MGSWPAVRDLENLKFTISLLSLALARNPPYMTLHSNKEDGEKEREKRLARLMNTGRYGCGVDGYGFKR